MKAILYCLETGVVAKWESRLAAAGCEVSVGAGPISSFGDGEVVVLVSPSEGPGVSARAEASLQEMRVLVREGVPIFVCGGFDAESAERLFCAGATDILPDKIETADLAARLRSACAWSRKLAGSNHDAEIQKRIHASLVLGLAHDYNNLLSAIQGNVDLSLMNPSLSAELKYNLDQIGQAAQRAAHLTRHVLETTRRGGAESGSLDLNESIRGLRTVLRECSGGAELDFRPGALAGPARVSFDALAMALSQLAEILASGAGVLELTTLAGDGGRSELSMRFSGETFSSGSQERVGEAFGRIRAMLEPHGASLETMEGRGVRLIFQPAAPSARESSSTRVDADPRTPVKILLVDDEDAVRTAMQRILRKEGYTVLEAGSGEEGLELFRSVGGMLDAVILDLNLPGIEGGEVLHHIRNLRPEVRVVVWSGYPEDVARKRVNGFSDVAFVEKPAQLAEFPAILGRILSRR